MNFYIFRHGETLETKNNIPYMGDEASAKILSEGIPALERLAEYLLKIETDLNVSSPYKRCKETVKIVSQISKKEFVYDPRLGEYYQETFEEFSSKIKDFLAEIQKKDYQNVAICTHGGVIAGLVYLLTSGNFYEENLNDFPRPGVLVTIEHGAVTYHDFNLGF